MSALPLYPNPLERVLGGESLGKIPPELALWNILQYLALPLLAPFKVVVESLDGNIPQSPEIQRPLVYELPHYPFRTTKPLYYPSKTFVLSEQPVDLPFCFYEVHHVITPDR